MDEAYLPGLSPVENKELCVRFDGGRLSSDGGVLVRGSRSVSALQPAACPMRAIQRGT